MEYNIYDLMDEFADEDIELSPFSSAPLTLLLYADRLLGIIMLPAIFFV